MPHEPDDNLDLPSSLADRLRGSHDRIPFVPSEVDARVLADARNHLAVLRWRRLILYRIGPAVAAAAAIAIAAWVVSPFAESEPSAPLLARHAPADIDHSGRVDILDAYKLAKLIDSLDPASPDLALDVTADGNVDRRDVDAVAQQAVSLSGGGGRTSSPAGGAG